jgi:lysophospholipase L1-like esterase
MIRKCHFCRTDPFSFCAAAWAVFVIQALASGCGIVMGTWVEMPGIVILTSGLLGACSVAARMASGTRRMQVWKWGLIIAWSCTAIEPAGLLLGEHKVACWDDYYAVLAWLTAAVILLAGQHMAEISWKSRWRILGMAWAFVGSFIWLAAFYLRNLSGAFFVGWLVVLILLIVCKSWFRVPALGVQVVNTLILFLIGLPLVDLLVRTPYRLQPLDPDKKYYTYEMWKKDPGGFDSWHAWNYRQWGTLAREFYTTDPAHILPYRLKPNHQGVLWQSLISINGKGFRSREISEEKGNTYRIVALGESTTFGFTTTREDKPWPEFLEQIIQERLKPQRPVQVINAGAPGYTLKDNLYRIPTDILPLKPDMIISYHGLNGFPMLNDALPSLIGAFPAIYKERPLGLLAKCEYRLKIMYYTRRQISRLVHHPPTITNVMDTEYAQAYRQLIQIAHTNGIRLVVANFSMAVNDKSDPDLIDFYQRTGYPFTRWEIQANSVHSQIISRLAQQYPDVCFVDTHLHLDGEHEKYTDLVHFSEEGDHQLAETVFAGIKSVLEHEEVPGK